jgi:hypothetical protein
MTGPCAKARVICTIVAPTGDRFVGENLCANPQPVCPRQPGEGYEKCKTVCGQLGHAEEVAARIAGAAAVGGTAYLEGHTYACDPCKAALAAVGVTDIVIGAPA